MSAPRTPPAALARSRRAFLRSVGGAATALPFYRLLEASAVHAAPGDAPQRFVGLYHPHGVAEPFFARRAGETETTFELRFTGSVLAPFDDAATHGRSFRDRITTVEGLDLAASVEKKVEPHLSPCVLLTGSAPRDNRTANESIDQYLAVTRGLGADTRFTSLVLGAGNRQTFARTCLSFATGGAPLPKLTDPVATFDRLFANLRDATDTAGQALLAERRRRGKSVLDFLRQDLGRLNTRLAAPERVKLEQHLGSLRELEKRLEAPATGPAATPSCHRPERADPAAFPPIESDEEGDEAQLNRIVEVQLDLLAQALACDLTRFATLFIGMTEDVHRNVAHLYEGPWGKVSGDRTTWPALADQNRGYYRQAARFLQRLSEMGVLDSALLLMTSDMGDPSRHSVRNVPTVLAGGANGAIRMGRRVVLPSECPASDFDCAPPRLSANNKLLVTVAQAFHCPVDSFGSTVDPAASSGALSELL
jgi:hypothetical protein